MQVLIDISKRFPRGGSIFTITAIYVRIGLDRWLGQYVLKSNTGHRSPPSR